MIGKLKGTLSEIFGTEALIETSGGVFYKVHITPALAQKGVSSDQLELYTYLNVKEDDLTLFGFDTYQEYTMFTYLIAIDGVGPKTAYLIVSSSSPADIRTAVHANDVAFFQKIKGIGKKTAQRILIDLSAKFGSEFDITAGQETADDIDALDALVSLGFKRKDAKNALEEIDSSLALEERIKLALQSIKRR